MHNNIENYKYFCRVCGYNFYPFISWGESGKDPEHSICESCGCQAGYQDCLRKGVLNWRKKWIDSGYKWHDTLSSQPQNWNPRKQLDDLIELENKLGS